MSDYISRQAAIDAICRACNYDKDDFEDCSDRNPNSTFCDSMSALRRVPSADAVEVIRCKDCKHKTVVEIGMVYCPRVIGSWVEDNWFCADAERRNDDEIH